VDVEPGVREVEQGRCVDHVASHGLTIAKPDPAGPPASHWAGGKIEPWSR
jgi:hypothetical protein